MVGGDLVEGWHVFFGAEGDQFDVLVGYLSDWKGKSHLERFKDGR